MEGGTRYKWSTRWSFGRGQDEDLLRLSPCLGNAPVQRALCCHFPEPPGPRPHRCSVGSGQPPPPARCPAAPACPGSDSAFTHISTRERSMWSVTPGVSGRFHPFHNWRTSHNLCACETDLLWLLLTWPLGHASMGMCPSSLQPWQPAHRGTVLLPELVVRPPDGVSAAIAAVRLMSRCRAMPLCGAAAGSSAGGWEVGRWGTPCPLSSCPCQCPHGYQRRHTCSPVSKTGQQIASLAFLAVGRERGERPLSTVSGHLAVLP